MVRMGNQGKGREGTKNMREKLEEETVGFWPVHSFTCSPLTKTQGEMLSYGKGGSEAEASICGTEMKAPR